MLFEILTGRPPFEGPTVQEVLRRVANEAPAAVHELCPQAPTELQAIVGKALQRAKKDRYASAQQLAEDISAYMTGRRVLAYEYSGWELLKRFAGRHKAALAALFAVLVVVVAALIVVAVAWRREADARAREHAERLLAHHHLAQAYARQAERLADDKNLSSARIFAAASLLNNPSYPKSAFFDPAFGNQEPDSLWLQAGAISLVMRSDFNIIKRAAWTGRMPEGCYDGAWAPDGSVLASSDQRGLLHLWEPKRGTELRSWQAHVERILAVGFSPDSQRIASAGRDKRINIWETSTARLVTAIPLQEGGAVTSLSFSPDGTRLAWGDERGNVTTVHTADLERRVSFQPHLDQVRGVAWSDDSRWLATGSWDKVARIHQASSGAVLHTLSGHTGSIYRVAFAPGGTRLATAGYDKTARIWDVQTGTQTGVLEGSQDAVLAVAFSPDGRRIATGGIDRHVRLWDALDGKLLASAEVHTEGVSSLAFSPDSDALATFSQDRTLRVWELSKDEGIIRLRHGDWIARLAYAPDGTLLATAGADRTVRIWDARTGLQTQVLTGHTDLVQSVSFSADGKRVVSASPDETARIWDVGTGALLSTLRGQDGGVLDAQLSPDGNLVAIVGRDKAVYLRDPNTGAEVATLRDHADWVYSVAFSPDGKLLATASGDHTVNLYELAGPKLLRTLRGHTDWAYSVAFSPDSTSLFSAGKDWVVLHWELESGRILRRFSGHASWVNHVTLSSSGKLLTTACDDRLAGLWDAQTGTPLMLIRAGMAVTSASLSPGGDMFAVTDNDVVLQVPVRDLQLQPEPAELLRQAEELAGAKLRDFVLRPAQ